MRRPVFIICLLLGSIACFSQQQYFVYIQADGRQPFYAKIDKKIYSSSESGYMIIPKLADSTYQITVGFAKAAFPEQQFPVTVNKKDNGFELKNFGEKGWGLFNLQTLAVVMATGDSSKAAVASFEGSKKTDAFSELLANVVNDSAILYTAVKPKAADATSEKTAATSAAASATEKDSIAVTTPVSQPNIIAEQPAPDTSLAKPATTATSNDGQELIPEQSPTKDSAAAIPDSKDAHAAAGPVTKVEKPLVTKSGEDRSDSTYNVTFLERRDLATDTIHISIPLEEGKQKQAEPATEPAASQSPDNKAVRAESQAQAQKVTTVEKKPGVVVINSDCKNFATDADVDKLRVRLMAQQAIDDKLSAARKVFKTRCFTVKQVRALTELYPSDETKYRFFELAYPFISDPGNVYLLEESFGNDIFKNRFKGLIHQ